MPESPRQERKVVTVLFADLVGFTGRAETMDPEDVVGLLAPYHARLRSELERYGGTVEKFIGDAVMAVFGAPVAHEDDPERAARAALAIRDWATDERNLEVRIAVNTGEALVNLGARPELGEAAVVGDVVNTASRLQSAAPVNGILVAESTYRATRDAIEYREAQPVEAKGKADPIPVWAAVQARSRLGVDVEQRARTPLVGREREFELVLSALARTRAECEPQLVTIVGVPGIGKTRLIWGVFEAVERDPELLYWRQGRCLPYGDGVTYWALGEMVKAQAGILDTDSADEARAKLEQAVETVAGEGAERIASHLRPLIGLGDDGGGGEGRRVDAFAAWRRFFEGLAEQRPLVLVFEDLHWADEGLLEFVEHLVDWATGVPLLVICSARPELLERRPTWGGGKLNATTLALAPLSEKESARLIAAVLDRAMLPAETQAALLSSAGGNPLYAEQYARLFLERGTTADMPLPENVQGLIAARLDGLSGDEKAALQDAAVVGKVFWPGALAAVGVHERPLDEILHSLERKDFVRRERRSTVGGETEYAFRHVLVRDVAYGQIPRAPRAEKHRRAAEWIEVLSEREEDAAEMLAHHYSRALEYGRAAGQETSELAARARLALQRAGERALALSAFEPARRFLEAALELWPEEDPGRALLQLALGRALHWLGEPSEELFLSTRDELLGQGKLDDSASAEMLLAWYWWNRGAGKRTRQHAQQAARMIEGVPPSRSKTNVLSELGVHSLVSGELDDAIRHSTEARTLAGELCIDDLRAQALITLGSARFSGGDHDGIADLEAGLALGEELGSGEIMIRACKNLSDARLRNGQAARAFELQARGLATAQTYGDRFHVRWFSGERTLECYLTGRWDEALDLADRFVAEVAAGSPHYMEPVCLYGRALISVARGDAERAAADSERALDLCRSVGDNQVLLPAIALRARVLAASGGAREALPLLDEVAALSEAEGTPGLWTADFAWTCASLGRRVEFSPRLRRSRWLRAAEAIIGGDHTGAAEVYAGLGSGPDEADARLLAARRLVEEGRRTEADEQLGHALAFYRSVGATAYLREAESLLAASA